MSPKGRPEGESGAERVSAKGSPVSPKGRPEGESGAERVSAKGSPVIAAPAVAVTLAGAGPRFTALPPLSLYVHIPWCIRKCPYCDFNSHEARAAPDEAAYVDALLADVESALPGVWGRKVGTVFIGGGTPSLFSPAAIDRLLSGLRARLPIVPDVEVTLEANPGTFERARFAGYFAAGVNRLSLGVQSFTPRHLEALGRVHGADEARRAAEAALTIFGNVNLDLMFALPGQTLAECETDVAAALAFGTPHLSFYQLTIEPNTSFHHEPPPALPDHDLAADMQEVVAARLAGAGYTRYEVSAYAKPGRECAHNVNYWRFGDYLGIGAGAHAKVSLPDRIVREVRFKQPQQYLTRVAAGDAVMERREVARDEIGFEFMLNALRLTGGVPAPLFAERTGHSLVLVAPQLADGVRRGLIDADPARIVATETGQRFLNTTLEMFLPAGDRAAPAGDAPVAIVEAPR